MHPRAAPLSPKGATSPRHSPRLEASRTLPTQTASARLGALQAHSTQVSRDPSRPGSDPRLLDRGPEHGYAEFDAAPATSLGASFPGYDGRGMGALAMGQDSEPAGMRRAGSHGPRPSNDGAYPAMPDARARAFPPEQRPLHAGAGSLHFGSSKTEVPMAYRLFETQHQREMESLKQQIEEAQARAVPSSMKTSGGLRRPF